MVNKKKCCYDATGRKDKKCENYTLSSHKKERNLLIIKLINTV